VNFLKINLECHTFSRASEECRVVACTHGMDDGPSPMNTSHSKTKAASETKRMGGHKFNHILKIRLLKMTTSKLIII
jgi:hypothetical protein